MFERFARHIIRYRAAVLAAVALVGLACLFSLPHLGFDFTPQQIFRSASDAHAYREVFAERYGREDNVIFVLVSAENIYEPRVLHELREATKAAAAVEAISRADSLVTIDIPRPGDGPGSVAMSPVIAPGEPIGEEQGRRLREAVEREPLLHGRLVDEGATMTPIVLEMHADVQEVSRVREVLEEVERAVADELGNETEVKWGIGGIPAVRTRIVDDLRRDQLTFIPIIGLLYVLVLFVLFRRFAGVVLPLVTVGFALVCLLALLVATGSPINILNNVLPSLIFVIAASDGIHMLQRDAEEAANLAQDGRDEAVVGMMRHTGAACLLTSVTTAIGFFSLYTADTRLLQQFSWQAGVGVLFAFGATIVILPAALPYLRPVKRSFAVSDAESPVLRTIGEFVLRRPRFVLVAGVALIAASLALTTRVRVDAFLFDIFGGEPPAVRVVTAQIEEHLGGVLPVEISLEGEPGTFRDPGRFAAIHRVQRFADAQANVLSTESFVDYHQSTRVHLLGDTAERDVMPTSAEQVAQLHTLLTVGPDERTGVRRFVDDEFANARILVRVPDAGGRATRQLGAKLTESLDRAFGDDPDIRYVLTGDAWVAALALDSFVRELFGSLMLAFIVILFVMTLAFRSLKLGIISMVPNALPLLITSAYMGLAGIPLDVTTMTTFAIGLGLAVDDTIHFLSRFREEFDRGVGVDEALLATYQGAGRAIVFTSVLLVVGIGVLQISSFEPTRIFSRLMVLTVIGAVVADLVVLPPILKLVYGKK